MRGRCRGTSPSRPWTEGPRARRAGARPRSPARRGRDRTAADPARRRRSRRPSPSSSRGPSASGRRGVPGRKSASAASSRRFLPAVTALVLAPAPIARVLVGGGSATLPLPPVTLGPTALPHLAPLAPAEPARGRQLLGHARGRLARLDLARPAVSRPSHRRRAAARAEPVLDDLGSGARPRARPGLPPLRQREADPPAARGHPGVPRGAPRRPAARDRRHQPSAAAARWTSTPRTRTASTSTSTTRASTGARSRRRASTRSTCRSRRSC